MNAAVLDTLRCAQTLKTAGFDDNQAEAMAQVLGDALTDVATKTDLDNAVAGLDAKIDSSVAGLEAKIDTLDAKIDSSVAQLDTKIGAVNQRLDSFETSVQRQIESLVHQFTHQFRVAYGIMGILAALILGSLVAPHLSWGATATPPAPIKSPAPALEVHSAPAQTSIEGQPLVDSSETPPPPPST